MINTKSTVPFSQHETLAICDLDAAIAAKDADKKNPDRGSNSIHTEICLLAQFVMRITGERVAGSTSTDAALESNPHFYRIHVEEKVRELVHMFDCAYQYNDSISLERIRKLLPMDVKVSVEPPRL